ncbi:Serine/threonine-protein kinase DCLK2 [Elaphomyces granulatus]
MPQNKSRCIPPQIVLETSNVRSCEAREATKQPEGYDDLLDSPRIGLKFSDGAKTKYGVVMGWASDCDIILPKKGISRYHAALSFDKENHLIVREPPQSQQQIDNVTRLHQGIADTADLIEFLRVRSLPATWDTHFIVWTKKLGEGKFGIVTHILNVRTGEEYTLKEPVKKFLGKGGCTMKDWRKEAKIMSYIQHDHIVVFLGAKFTPWPQLSFEYANGGSLDHYLATLTLDEFADFGLANTQTAPEIYAKVVTQDTERYTVGVDIWSLAMVFAERAGGLPDYYKKSTTAWNKAVLEHFWNQPEKRSELIPFLLDNMLLIELQKGSQHRTALQLFGRLSQRQAPARSVVSDSHRSLIVKLGYRGSIVNSTDDDESTFRRSCAPPPDIVLRSRGLSIRLTLYFPQYLNNQP